MHDAPSAPAFRLPFQEIDSNNHIAQWTEVVVPVQERLSFPTPLPKKICME
ncbi:MAG: hypothetical protein ABI333_07940 [bacterium]